MTFKQRVTIQLLKTRFGAIWANRLQIMLQKCWESTEVGIGKRLSPDLTVLAGPFAGLRFASIDLVALSKVLPKLIGSYEQELHETIESLPRDAYETVVNIGCAEGYYAVGMARRFPKASVYAYDINTQSLQLAGEMAQLNGVSGQISFHGLFSPASTREFSWKTPVLVLCDCEGAEYDLFTPEIWNGIAFDALIEIHNCPADTGKAAELAQRFSATHHAQWIRGTLRDETRYPQLSSFSPGERYRILDEGRPGLMDWLWLKRKEA